MHESCCVASRVIFRLRSFSFPFPLVFSLFSVGLFSFLSFPAPKGSKSTAVLAQFPRGDPFFAGSPPQDVSTTANAAKPSQTKGTGTRARETASVRALDHPTVNVALYGPVRVRCCRFSDDAWTPDLRQGGKKGNGSDIIRLSAAKSSTGFGFAAVQRAESRWHDLVELDLNLSHYR